MNIFEIFRDKTLKREASHSRRSSISSNINEPELQELNITNDKNNLESHMEQDLGYSRHVSNQKNTSHQKFSSPPRQYQSSNNMSTSIPLSNHTPIEYGSPKKKSVAVQMQVRSYCCLKLSKSIVQHVCVQIDYTSTTAHYFKIF